jgi:hypothetical protein
MSIIPYPIRSYLYGLAAYQILHAVRGTMGISNAAPSTFLGLNSNVGNSLCWTDYTEHNA